MAKTHQEIRQEGYLEGKEDFAQELRNYLNLAGKDRIDRMQEELEDKISSLEFDVRELSNRLDNI